MQMLSSAKDCLRNIFISGEYDDSNEEMHGRARLANMLFKYSKERPSQCLMSEIEFLMDGIQVLEESKGIRLPNFLPRTAFHNIAEKESQANS